jgi:hypothetical protein
MVPGSTFVGLVPHRARLSSAIPVSIFLSTLSFRLR